MIPFIGNALVQPSRQHGGALYSATGALSDFDQLAHDTEALQRLVTESRRLGYVTREASATGSDSPENIGALSVPIFSADTLVACLSCSWLPGLTHQAEIASAHLASLRTTADLIGRRLHAAGIGSPVLQSHLI